MKKISIVIATYNRAQSLLRILHSVVGQTAPAEKWECVVVNNNSTDDTEAVFADFAAAHPTLDLKMVTETKQGLSNARNCGIAASRGEYIAIVDDDETLEDTFAESYIDFFDAFPTAMAAGGAVKACYESTRPRWMSHFTEQMIANPLDLGREIITITSTVTPTGGNMAFNRELFNLYGAFDTTLGRKGDELFGGEENDMFKRIRDLGERVFYTPHAVAYHHIADRKLTPEYFDRLSYGVGVSKRLRAEKLGTEEELFSDERKKRFFTKILAIFYGLTFQFQKAKWLVRMRNGISKGIFEE